MFVDTGPFPLPLEAINYLTGNLSGCNGLSGLAQFRTFIFISLSGTPGFLCGNNKDQVLILGRNSSRTYQHPFQLPVNIYLKIWDSRIGNSLNASRNGIVNHSPYHMWRKIDKNKYGLQPIFDGKLLKRLFYLSVWSMLHSFISMAPWFLFFIAIEHLGKMELAVSNITRSVSTLFFVIVSSLGATNGSLVSNLLGAGQQKGVFPICHKIIKMGYAIGFPLVGVALFCDYWIIGFYTNNETLVQHTVPPFIVMLFNYIFAVPGYVYISAVTGTGKTKIAFIFQVVTIMVYLLYLYWLSHCVHAPLAVYMTTEYLFVIMLGIQSVIYLKRKHY